MYLKSIDKFWQSANMLNIWYFRVNVLPFLLSVPSESCVNQWSWTNVEDSMLPSIDTKLFICLRYPIILRSYYGVIKKVFYYIMLNLLRWNLKRMVKILFYKGFFILYCILSARIGRNFFKAEFHYRKASFSQVFLYL